MTISQEREKLAEHVETGPMNGPANETGIHFDGTVEQFAISSYKNTIVRSLLQHDECTITWIVCETAEGGHKRFESVEDVWDTFDDPAVLSVAGRMPIGALTIKGSPRSQNHQSQIINTPSQLPDSDAWGDDDE